VRRANNENMLIQTPPEWKSPKSQKPTMQTSCLAANWGALSSCQSFIMKACSVFLINTSGHPKGLRARSTHQIIASTFWWTTRHRIHVAGGVFSQGDFPHCKGAQTGTVHFWFFFWLFPWSRNRDHPPFDVKSRVSAFLRLPKNPGGKKKRITSLNCSFCVQLCNIVLADFGPDQSASAGIKAFERRRSDGSDRSSVGHPFQTSNRNYLFFVHWLIRNQII